MPIAEHGRWSAVLAAYEAARDAVHAASDALDELPVALAADSEEERRCEALRRTFEAQEEALLGMAAPTLEGVAYQLRVFGERHLCAVMDEPETGGEDRPAGEHLRRILEGLQAHLPARSSTDP